MNDDIKTPSAAIITGNIGKFGTNMFDVLYSAN